MANVGKAQLVSRFDWQAMLRGQFQLDTFVEQAQRYIDQANEVEQIIHDRRTEIDHNANLSPQGRNNALAQIRERLRPRVREFAVDAEGWRGTRQREEAKRIEPEPEGEALVVAMRAQEIRQLLRGADQGAVLGVLQKAGEDGDMETVRAIENAPKFAPLADVDAIARMREGRLAKRFPEGTARIADQTALIELLDLMAQHLEYRLEG